MSNKFLNFLFILLPILMLAQNSERNLSSEKWDFRKATDINWLLAKVPGTVHTDLFNNKIIPNPFFGDNEKQLQWIENEDWEYQTTFSISKIENKNKNCILQLEGLDTYADVFLNEKKILSVNNMFRTWNVSINKELKIGRNTLRIIFFSSVKKEKEAAKKLLYTLPGDEKVFSRKAQYHYGWDWGPRFVTAGIWKNIKLQFWNSATITNVKHHQKLLNDIVAELEFITKINSHTTGEFQLKINDNTEIISLKKGLNTITSEYKIQNPKRWWANGLGEANLYTFEISLSQNKKTLHSKKLNIGLRTIELVQKNDTVGKSFYFKLNGIPVFMKGANYIPPDSFLPRATDSVYKNIVKNAVDSNMNMLRVWGGGVYADDIFYDECDKNGILVWQDFMFACAMYPGDDDFLENVKMEVVDNVNRLQNHPSIALWCGNNENDEGWKNWGWQKQYQYSKSDSTKIWNDYKKLFHKLIPQTLDSLLSKSENRYWPSSPSIGWGKKESLLEGDSHYWGVWWGKEPFQIYEKKVGRFMSEYGFQGMPNLETFKAFANKEELNFNSEALKNHQKHGVGYQTIEEYMERDFQIPTSFEDYIYVSQLLQAEGMKMAMEAHRRAKPYCMGTLFWQLNDCWPVTSWSAVDYYGRWKAFQYQVKRSFEMLLISVKEENDCYKIYFVNDKWSSLQGELNLELINFNGKKLWEAQASKVVPENSSTVQFIILKKDFETFNLNNIVLSMNFKSESTKAKSLYYFVKTKNLNLSNPNIKIKKIDEVTIEVTSDVLAKNVYLNSSEDAFFSDNYFDVLPNHKMIIHLSKPVSIIISKSLFDTTK